MFWIAVDAMGGDDAPRHVIDGALAAVRNAVVMAHRFASDRFIQRIEGDIAVSAVPHP